MCTNLLGVHVQKFCLCLALLPKSKGDGDSWSLLMQRILFSINVHLTDAFQGVEEGILYVYSDNAFADLRPRLFRVLGAKLAYEYY